MKHWRSILPVPIDLLKKHYFYSERSFRSCLDGFGFLEEDLGDSLLFSGLYASSIEPMPYEPSNIKEIDMTQAEGIPGKFYRHPLLRGDKWKTESSSSISRDMLLGLLYWIWRKKRLDVAMRLAEYGKKHWWMMGEYSIITAPYKIVELQSNLPPWIPKCMTKGIVKHAGLTAVIMTPGLIALLYEIIYRLGGENSWRRYLPNLEDENQTGYQAHLQALYIALYGEVCGYITETQLAIMEGQAIRQSKNALFTAIYAKYTDDIALKDFFYQKTCNALSNERLFPSNRLPTTDDRESQWLWEWEERSDWLPSLANETTVHSGGDYTFVISIMRK